MSNSGRIVADARTSMAIILNSKTSLNTYNCSLKRYVVCILHDSDCMHFYG